MSTPTYDPSAVIIIFAGNRILGYADGTFVKVSRNSETFKLYKGTSGEGARAKSLDKSATVTLTLMHTSPSNDILAANAALDEAASSGVTALLIKDLSGRTIHQAQEAWVKKPADSEFGKEIATREWTIECNDISMGVNGS